MSVRTPVLITDPEAAVERARRLAEGPGRTGLDRTVLDRTVLGIVGPPGAGKSTLTDLLLPRLAEPAPTGLGAGSSGGAAVGHLPMDGFHLADVQLDRLGNRDRKGAPDTYDVAGYVSALSRLHTEPGEVLYVPGFERELEQPIAAAIAIGPQAGFVITEGNYLLHDRDGWERVAPLLTEIWYVDLDPAVRVRRLVARHERFGKSPAQAREWVARSDEANARLIEAGRARADVIVRIDDW